MSKFLSLRKDEIADVEENLADQFIEDGLAEEYNLVEPTGKLSITSANEVNCAPYATAQVEDENLVAENIKNGVEILGVTGSLEGGATQEGSFTISGIAAGKSVGIQGLVEVSGGKIVNKTQWCNATTGDETFTVAIPTGLGAFVVMLSAGVGQKITAVTGGSSGNAWWGASFFTRVSDGDMLTVTVTDA